MEEFKIKPCQTDYCPLIDEHRLFADSQEKVYDYGINPYSIVPMVIKVWCHGAASRQVNLDPLICRNALRQIMDSVSIEHFNASLAARLRVTLDSMGKTQQANSDHLGQRLFDDVEPF